MVGSQVDRQCNHTRARAAKDVFARNVVCWLRNFLPSILAAVMQRKIAVIGTGSAGLLTAAHLCTWLGDGWQVCCVYNPKKPILGIGESTNGGVISVLERATNFSLAYPEDLAALDATIKYGSKFTNWRKQRVGESAAQRKHRHPLQQPSPQGLRRRAHERALAAAVQRRRGGRAGDPELRGPRHPPHGPGAPRFRLRRRLHGDPGQLRRLHDERLHPHGQLPGPHDQRLRVRAVHRPHRDPRRLDVRRAPQGVQDVRLPLQSGVHRDAAPPRRR